MLTWGTIRKQKLGKQKAKADTLKAEIRGQGLQAIWWLGYFVKAGP